MTLPRRKRSGREAKRKRSEQEGSDGGAEGGEAGGSAAVEAAAVESSVHGAAQEPPVVVGTQAHPFDHAVLAHPMFPSLLSTANSSVAATMGAHSVTCFDEAVSRMLGSLGPISRPAGLPDDMDTFLASWVRLLEAYDVEIQSAEDALDSVCNAAAKAASDAVHSFVDTARVASPTEGREPQPPAKKKKRTGGGALPSYPATHHAPSGGGTQVAVWVPLFAAASSQPATAPEAVQPASDLAPEPPLIELLSSVGLPSGAGTGSGSGTGSGTATAAGASASARTGAGIPVPSVTVPGLSATTSAAASGEDSCRSSTVRWRRMASEVVEVDKDAVRRSVAISSRVFVRGKQERSRLPTGAQTYLKEWLLDHFGNPYPDNEEKAALGRACGMAVPQISIWFQNARQRFWKPIASGAVRVDDVRDAVMSAPTTGFLKPKKKSTRDEAVDPDISFVPMDMDDTDDAIALPPRGP